MEIIGGFRVFLVYWVSSLLQHVGIIGFAWGALETVNLSGLGNIGFRSLGLWEMQCLGIGAHGHGLGFTVDAIRRHGKPIRGPLQVRTQHVQKAIYGLSTACSPVRLAPYTCCGPSYYPNAQNSPKALYGMVFRPKKPYSMSP